MPLLLLIFVNPADFLIGVDNINLKHKKGIEPGSDGTLSLIPALERQIPVSSRSTGSTELISGQPRVQRNPVLKNTVYIHSTVIRHKAKET